MLIPTTEKSIEYIRPQYLFDENEIIENYGSVDNWYIANARWVASHYNMRDRLFLDGGTDGSTNLPNQNFFSRWGDSPVAEIQQNYKYLFGEQENFNYNYLINDEKGGQVPTPFIKGKKLQNLILFMQGNMRKLMSASRISVESLNPSRVSKKMEELQMMELKRDFEEWFKKIEEQSGVGFYPEGMNQGSIDDAILEHARTPVDKMEGYGLDVLNDVANKNNLREKMIKAYTDVVIGRYCGTYVTERGGRMHIQTIPPYNLIYDNSKDDDFNMEAEFTGFIEYLSPEEVGQKWHLTKKERDLLDSLAVASDESGGLLSQYQIPQAQLGFEWVGTGARRRHLSCVTTFWLSEHYMEDENGKPMRTKGDEGEEYVSYLRIHKATIIANAVMKDYGLDTNVVYHPNLKYLPMFPLRNFIPNMFGGMNRSVVDLMNDNQDMIDAYKFKIREAVSKDLGKTYIFDGSRMKDLPNEIFSNLKSMGIHVSMGTDGETPDMLNTKPMTETIDMTLNKDVLAYVQLIAQENKEMEEVINASKIALGQQTSYVGLAAQQQTISQNEMGMASYTDGFMQYYSDNLQYILNKAKVMYMDNEGAEEAELMLSEDGIEFFKNSSEFQIEDMMVRVEIEDIIDDSARQRLLDIALAMAQNTQHSGFDMSDYLVLETARTYTELKKAFAKILAEKNLKKEEQQKMMMMVESAEREKQRQFQTQQQGMAEKGKNDREMVKAETDLAVAGMDGAFKAAAASEE